MSDILGSVRLKERILIIVITLVGALLIGSLAGAVTYATTDRHQHDYIYHMERGADGEFDFIGECQFEGCQNPTRKWDILSGVTHKVKTDATCTATGVMEYSFIFKDNGKTYTYTEEIPMDTHTYKCEIVTEDGISTITGTCIYKDCSQPTLSIDGATDLKVDHTIEGSCRTPHKDVYSYTVDGVKGSFVAQGRETAAHKLNGKFVTEYEISDGVYLYGTPGMVPVGVQVLGCGMKTGGYYVCEECGKAVAATIGKPDHNYVISESDIINPTLLANGQLNLVCIAEGCDGVKKITLPKAEIGVNATVESRNCAIGKQVLNYTYPIEGYALTANLKLELNYNEHDFKYVPEETVAPTANRDGYAVLRCAAEGCSASARIVLNKIELEDEEKKNSVVLNEATEMTPKKVLYTYVSEKYALTIELELSIGTVLPHNYVYELVFVGDNKFDLVGTCNQKDCQTPEVREENVVPECTDTSTCQTPGDLIYTYVKDGITYTLTMVNFQLGSHNVETVGKVTNPTLFEEGSVTIRCTTEGCGREETIALPVIRIGENATAIEDNKVLYVYHYDELDYTIALTLAITIEQTQ